MGAAMENGEAFVDLYALLQVTPTCDSAMLEKAYRHYAQMYHPDHSDTADVEKFQEVIAAYKVLRDPGKRAEYDTLYRIRHSIDPSLAEESRIPEKEALDDAEMHEQILHELYKRRREHARDPGLMAFYLEEKLGCSEEDLEFHVWYLRSKGYVEVTQDSALAITVDGVDHVISRSRAAEAERLLIPQAKAPAEDEEE